MWIIPSRIVHTIYKSARIVLMDAVISITQVAPLITSKFEYMVQKFCPFLMNVKHVHNQLAAKLIVIRAWRRMITMTTAHRMAQHLLMTAIYFSLGVIVEMLLAHIYSTMWQRECRCICLSSNISQHLCVKALNFDAHHTIAHSELQSSA